MDNSHSYSRTRSWLADTRTKLVWSPANLVFSQSKSPLLLAQTKHSDTVSNFYFDLQYKKSSKINFSKENNISKSKTNSTKKTWSGDCTEAKFNFKSTYNWNYFVLIELSQVFILLWNGSGYLINFKGCKEPWRKKSSFSMWEITSLDKSITMARTTDVIGTRTSYSKRYTG